MSVQDKDRTQTAIATHTHTTLKSDSPKNFPRFAIEQHLAYEIKKQLSKFATRLIGSIVLTLSRTIAIKVSTT